MPSYLSSAIVSAATGGIFGCKRLVSGYAGHAFDLRYQGDNATLTVDFLGDDTLDVASIATWVAARTGGPSNVRITKWYDQSGLGNNLAQASALLQPTLETGSVIYKGTYTGDGFPCVYFNEANAPTNASTYMDSSGGTFSNRNFSVLMAGRYNDQDEAQQNGGPGGLVCQLGTASGAGCSLFSTLILNHQSAPITAHYARNQTSLNGANPITNTTTSARAPNTSLSAIAYRNNGTTFTSRIGNWRNLTFNSIGTLATGLTGFRVGNAFGTTFPSAVVATGYIVGTALGTSDEQDALDTLAANWGISNSADVLLGTDGDSITASHLGVSWPNRRFSWFNSVVNSVGSRAVGYNLAQDGGWIGTVNSPWGPLSGEGSGTAGVQQGGQAPDSLDPLLDSGQFAKQILVVFMGRNDIGLFGSGAAAGFGTTIYNQLVIYCQARRAAGWKVVVCDAIPGSDIIAGNMASERAIFNALIAANWPTFADAFVQLSALNWQPGGSSDWSLYQDQVHPTATGQAMIAAAVLPAVQQLINPNQVFVPFTNYGQIGILDQGGTFVPLSSLGQLGVMTY